MNEYPQHMFYGEVRKLFQNYHQILLFNRCSVKVKVNPYWYVLHYTNSYMYNSRLYDMYRLLHSYKFRDVRLKFKKSICRNNHYDHIL